MTTLLREMRANEIPDEVRSQLAAASRRTGLHATVFEGVVTKIIRIVLHCGTRPSASRLRTLEAEEARAATGLPPHGGVQ